MPKMGLREYGRHRKGLGLPGCTATSVFKALASGRIVREADGRIDSDAADAAWRANTLQHVTADGQQQERSARRPNLPEAAAKHVAVEHLDRRERPRTRAEQKVEFCAGAAWMAREVCVSARKVWPAFVLEHWPDMSRPERIRLMALFCARLEVWTLAERATTAALPEFDWIGLFGPDAAAARGEYERLNQEWPAVGRIVLGCGPDATPGAAFMAGGRACARATCVAARQMLPRLIEWEVFEPGEDRSSTLHLLSVILAQLEGWVRDHVSTEWLPPIPWDSVFPDGAADAAEQYRALRAQWAG